MRLGVIDCGTNTFHLLVIEVDERGGFSRIHKERKYVRIGQEGVDKIGAAPFRRGVDCLAYYKKVVFELNVDQLKVFGTEALRRASNGPEFIDTVEKETGIRIQLISGEEEARLIHLGVIQAVPTIEKKGLIMDIGGGSVEFILASASDVYWARSFPIGVQVLFSAFHQQDPLPKRQVGQMERYFEHSLQPLLDTLKEHETPLLVGASGSFEVVESLSGVPHTDPLYSIVPTDDFAKIHQQIINASMVERLAIGVPKERVELIVVAFVLINFIVKNANIKNIVTSAYALKEGILYEMMQEYKRSGIH
ncbi:MAG: hypothetical protein AAFZ15_01870 [Bacteroidota bacterium]